MARDHSMQKIRKPAPPGEKFIFSVHDDFDRAKFAAIFYTNDNVVHRMELNSLFSGIAVWDSTGQIVSCHTWEDPDKAEDISYLSKHFTQTLLNGSAGIDKAFTILQEVKEGIGSARVVNWIQRLTSGQSIDGEELSELFPA